MARPLVHLCHDHVSEAFRIKLKQQGGPGTPRVVVRAFRRSLLGGEPIPGTETEVYRGNLTPNIDFTPSQEGLWTLTFLAWDPSDLPSVSNPSQFAYDTLTLKVLQPS